MSEGIRETAEKGRRILFELQSLLVIADRAGVETYNVRELLRKASVASRMGTKNAIGDMVSYLEEGKTALENSIMSFFTKQIGELRKEIDEKRENIPQNHPITISYSNAVNAVKRKDYETALRNTKLCRTDLSTVSKPDKGVAYGRFFARELVPCATCGGKVKAGFTVIKCICGKTHHESCAMREGKCTCGVKFGPHPSQPQQQA